MSYFVSSECSSVSDYMLLDHFRMLGEEKINQMDQTENDYSRGSGGYIKIQGTRKLDCSATIQVRAIKVFTEYKVNECASKKGMRKCKEAILQRFRDDLSKNKNMTTIMRYYFKIPLMLEHTSHPVGKSATVSHCVDGKVIDKIHELVSTNITNPVMVSKCLEQYVEKELFGNSSEKPSKSNRRYYPSRQDLRNHIPKAISVNKYSCDDQESLRVKVDEWKKKSPNSNYFLRTRDEVSGFKETKFLFVHQEEWQRKLLLRYGGELVLMYATYKRTKYAISLFFVCIHGNTGYTVVAEFMCQNEDLASIE